MIKDRHSRFNKDFNDDPIKESKELISIFSNIILECPVCLDKLIKEQEKENLSGVDETPELSGHHAIDDDNTQATSLQAGGKKYYQ